MNEYAISNKIFARARLQSKFRSKHEIQTQPYSYVTSSIELSNNCVGFAKEGQSMEKAGYCYFACFAMDVFPKVLNSTSSFYEIIPPDTLLKLFFDVDDAIEDYFYYAVENLLINCYPDIIKFILPRIILSSCTTNKSSYHIIYPTVVFANMNGLKNFINTVLAPLKSHFDSSVYSRYRLFHTYLKKYIQNRPFVYLHDTFYPLKNRSLVHY